jgi:hypothetical protein
VDESLLRSYARIHKSHTAIDLRGVAEMAPWIECLDDPFVEYASFRKLRENPHYIGILTFTTPAISDNGDVAFLEVWTEDGRFAQMGTWWWVDMAKRGLKGSCKTAMAAWRRKSVKSDRC